MSAPRPYHHGNLRQAVLERAAVMLRETAAPELSLRELTRAIGVSHTAPRRYFPDRQALLDALAVEGFCRLGDRLRDAAAAASEHPERVRSVAAAYVDFATAEPNLVELMFTNKHGAGREVIAPSAVEAFAPIVELFHQPRTEGERGLRDAERIGMLFLATFQGIAELISCGVVDSDRSEDLIADAVAQFSEPRVRLRRR